MKVILTEYQGWLVIETRDIKEPHPDFIPASNGRIGCTLLNTKQNLGVSKEALAWLSRVPASHDDIGDVMWWPLVGEHAGQHAFGWLGGPLKIMQKGEGQQGFKVFDAYVEVPNDVPKPARDAIDKALTRDE